MHSLARFFSGPPLFVMRIPRPATLEEARLFVGTVLERRFTEKAYTGWYAATISEVRPGQRQCTG